MILAVDKRDPARPARVGIDQNLVRDRVGAQRQVAGVHRGVNKPRRRVERGVNVAPARTPAAGAAPETLAAVLVLHAVRRHAGTVGRHRAVHRGETFAQLHFRGGQFVRALEQAVRQMRQILLVPADAEVEIDFVVVGLEIGVGDRPVLTVAVVRLPFEVVIGEA